MDRFSIGLRFENAGQLPQHDARGLPIVRADVDDFPL